MTYSIIPRQVNVDNETIEVNELGEIRIKGGLDNQLQVIYEGNPQGELNLTDLDLDEFIIIKNEISISTLGGNLYVNNIQTNYKISQGTSFSTQNSILGNSTSSRQFYLNGYANLGGFICQLYEGSFSGSDFSTTVSKIIRHKDITKINSINFSNCNVNILVLGRKKINFS